MKASSSMIEVQVLNKILIQGDLHLVFDNNLDETYFPNYKDEYKFIMKHYKKYGNVPDDLTFLNEFQEFPLQTVTETDRYLIEMLTDEKIFSSQLVPIFSRANEMTNGSSIELAEFLYTETSKILKNSSTSNGVDIACNYKERFENSENRSTNESESTISTGLPELDEIIGGWNYGEELAIILGRINQGKSWILQLFLSKAWEQGKKVLLYSGEMSANSVGYRFDTLVANISNKKISNSKMSEDELHDYRDILEANSEKGNNFIVVEPQDLGGKRLTISKLEMLIEKYQPDIVGIDQLSLMDDERGKYDSARIKMTHLAEDLFLVSKKFNIPVLAAAQANRNSAYKLEPTVPELHEIAESDGVGQNASKVISLVNKPSGLELKIVKNRSGENNKSLNYCWNIDKGIFTFLPELDNDDERDIPPRNTTTPKPRRVRRTRSEVNSEFSEGANCF